MILFSISVLVILLAAVTLLILIVRRLPSSVRATARSIQPLIAGCFVLAAAVIAYRGVVYSVDAQTESAQRQAQAETMHMAAALAGEIIVISQVFSSPQRVQANNKAIELIEQSMATGNSLVDFSQNKPLPDHAVIYRAIASRIGVFPAPIAQQIVRFYGTYIQIDGNMRTLDQAAKEGWTHMGRQNVVDALRDQNVNLEGLQVIKNDLVPKLEALAGETK
jgi:hypothetical protein